MSLFFSFLTFLFVVACWSLAGRLLVGLPVGLLVARLPILLGN